MPHIPVLLNEVITGLNIKPGDVFLDGTINGGGHGKAVAALLNEKGLIIGTDRDGAAIAKAGKALEEVSCRIILRQQSFRNLDYVLDQVGVKTADKILFDLGLSSNQFDQSGRGFSFQKDELLLMTFNDKPAPGELTASDIVNKWDEENIAQIILSYGEERFAEKIARAIVSERQKKPIETTTELAEIIKRALPKIFLGRRLHPATKTFQALRITVNDEIGALKEGLEKGFERLSVGGRFAVISFHSIEDRTVKTFWKRFAENGEGLILTKKPVTPSLTEIIKNPRSRSAKLRIIEKIK